MQALDAPLSDDETERASFRRALDQREIGGWVLDEAHCISK